MQGEEASRHAVGGTMSPVANVKQPGPQATQVVLVRGALLPMPQPGSMEDIPSPTVTPESATLMRLANSLSRQQPSGAAMLPSLGAPL